jgi:hypothetical protein
MLRAPMIRRLHALTLSLALLLAQQLGALHLLSHVLQPAAHTAAVAQADGQRATQADAGDALCQVCLVLATLAAASLPAVWGVLARRATAAAPRPPCLPAPARPAPAPYRARGPPALPALN